MKHQYSGITKFKTPNLFPCEVGEILYVRNGNGKIVETWTCISEREGQATYDIQNH